MHTQAIIFDLDGTLLDTLEDLRSATNYALKKNGFPVRTTEQVRAAIGNGVKQLMKRSLAPNVAEAYLDVCLEDFYNYYDQHLCEATTAYQGVDTLVDALHECGIQLAALSNKYNSAACRLIEHFFGDAFRMIVGECEDEPRKPDPTAALRILQELEVEAEHALYVGDSIIDMETARNAGITMAGACWGFSGYEVLRRAGVRNLLRAPVELLSML